MKELSKQASCPVKEAALFGAPILFPGQLMRKTLGER